MSDQAAGLRRLLERAPSMRVLGLYGCDAGLTSTAAAHLALALARRGEPVWVLDEADPPHNVATRYALTPGVTLARLLRDGGQAEAALQTGPEGVRLLALGGGAAWLAGLHEALWQAAAGRLAAVREPPQWVLFHARPGLDTDGLALYAGHRLLITDERKASLTKAYALLKGAQQRQPAERWQLVVMQARDEESAQCTHAALSGTARRFLGLEIGWAGAVPRDGLLADALRQLRPAQELPAASPAARSFRQLAVHLAEPPEAPEGCQPDGFWLKMWLFGSLSTDAEYRAGLALPPVSAGAGRGGAAGMVHRSGRAGLGHRT